MTFLTVSNRKSPSRICGISTLAWGRIFTAIHSLFQNLYGDRDDFADQAQKLVETMAMQYIKRPENLRRLDLAREKDYNWFLSQQLVGMALYCKGFAGNLNKPAAAPALFSGIGC